MAAELAGVSLDEALQNVAERSFYEDCIVTRGDDGTYSVTNDCDTLPTEELEYVDEGGSYSIKHFGAEPLSTIADDWSRLHEGYEYYDRAWHIRRNLVIVDELESGEHEAVAFAYGVVTNHCNYDGDTDCDPDIGCDCDYAGWILLAKAV